MKQWKTMKQRGLVFFLVVALLAGNLCMAPKEVKAAGHTREEAVNWAVSQINKGLDYDGYAGNQCVDLIKYYYAYFGVANYATGNANAYIYNNLPSGWTRVYGNYQPGDIAVWKTSHSCSTCNTTALGHVGIITSADSVGFNAVSQNHLSNPKCTQNWFYCSALACAIRPSFSSSQASSSVSFTDFRENGIAETNAEFYVKVSKTGTGSITNVGCYLYDANGTLLKSYRENCNHPGWCNYVCNINSDMGYTLKAGTAYKYILFAVVNGQEYRDVTRSFTTKGQSDNQKPQISDVSVYDITEDGYKVRCKASDNVGVVRVQFPTWTSSGGQDDIQANWATNTAAKGVQKDGYWVYEVKRSEHKNEYGTYCTHIYAYDKAGNYTCVAAPDTVLKKAEEESTQCEGGDWIAAVAQKEYDTYRNTAYNYQYGSSPWCCNFVSWCARQAGISKEVIKNTATVQTMYDDLINNAGAKVVSTPQRGDLVFYKYTNYDSSRFHHIGIMTSATESVQGNVNNTWWKGKPSALNNIKEMVYVRPAYNGEYVAPETPYFTEYELKMTEDNNAELYIQIVNPNAETISAAGCYLYDEDGALLESYSESCNWPVVNMQYNCNFIRDMKYTLSPGTTYKAVLYVVVGGKTIKDEVRTFTTTGTKKTENNAGATETDKETDTDTGTKTETDTKTESVVKPAKVTGLKLYTGLRKITVMWKTTTGEERTGYQVQYARNKSFTNSCTTRTVGSSVSMIQTGKLKKKNYYVRVRGINKKNNKTVYGEWSAIKKIKVKQ